MLAGATLFGRRGSGVAVNLPLASLAGKVAGGLTYTRASGQWHQDDAGVWQYVAANVPAFNSKGILLEPPSTNKCTCYGVIPADSYAAAVTSGAVLVLGRKYEIVTRATTDFTTKGAANNAVGTQFVLTAACTLGAGDSVKEVQFGVGTKSYHNGTSFVQNHTNMTLSGDTAAVLTTVDDTAALAAAGLSNLAASGKWYKIDNSAGAAAAYVTIAGSAGNLNPHSRSLFYLVDGAGCSVFMVADAASGMALNVIGAVTRAIKDGYVSTSSGAFQISVVAGRTLRILLPQLEELPFTTSPMPTAGATATRAATVPSFNTAGLRTNNLSEKFTWTPAAASQGTRWLWGSYLDANNYVGVLHDGTSLIFRKRIAGVNYDATKALTYVAGTAYNIGFRLSANGGSDIFINSVKGTANSNAASIVYGTTIKLGQDGNGGSLQAGGIKDFRIYSRVLVDGSF